MQKPEKIAVIIGGILLVVLAVYVYWRRTIIHSDRTYLLARVTDVTKGGENGPTYFFYYKFDNIKYERSVSGFFTMYDSLLIIKVSKSKPNLWLYTHLAVPKCIRDENKMDSSWDVLPSCSQHMPEFVE
jgi:hypothetical protein